MASPVGFARSCLLILVAAGAARAAEPITLHESFKVGRVRYLNIKTSTEKNTVVSFFPDPIGSVDEREWWIVATEGKEPKPGLATMTWRVDRLQARHRDMLGHERKPDEVFDSLRPNASPLAGAFGPWIDRSVIFWLNDRGEVVEMIDPPSGRPPLAHSPARPGSQAETFTADDFRRYAGEFYGDFLPDKPVALDDKWTRPYSVKRDPYGTLNGTITCVLKSVASRGDEKIARIEFAAALTLVPATQPARRGADEKRYEVKTATYDGWMEFDIAAGVPVAADAREDLQLNIIMTAASQPAKPTTRPSSQPAPKPMSFVFQLAETRRTQFDVSKTPPQKPIVVNPRPAPASAPAQFRQPVTLHPQTSQPRAPIGITPRQFPGSRPAATQPAPRPAD